MGGTSALWRHVIEKSVKKQYNNYIWGNASIGCDFPRIRNDIISDGTSAGAWLLKAAKFSADSNTIQREK